MKPSPAGSRPRAPAWLGAGPTRRLRARLLAWYRRHRRDLPWRRTRDPYRIWLSEVMLQQTTVKAVIPYYARFLGQFPSLKALAAASEDDVVAAWSGLGYYRRARSLRAGARHVVEHHAGRFPASHEDALRVPGVGPYTAAAVLSIAHGLPLAVVDGNVRRVLARLLLLRGAAASRPATLRARAQELLDPASPGDWNQAVMELGATVCTPRAPRCTLCPWRADCRARAAGAQDRVPAPLRRPAPRPVTVAAALFRRGTRVLLVRRRDRRVLRGMWELPQTPLDGRGRPDLPGVLQQLDLPARLGARVATAGHAITFRRITAELYRATPSSHVRAKPGLLRWVDPAALDGLPTSSLTRKLLQAAGAAAGGGGR